MPYIITAAVIVFLTALTLLVSYITYSIVFRRGKCVSDPYEGARENENFKIDLAEKVTRLLSAPYEEVRICSHDGICLHAKLYRSHEDAPVEILMHGYRSLAERDFSGGACEAMDRGHNVLLVDQRAHGGSEGKAISFGALEAEDCLGWISLVKERFGENVKIILVGISMGAATVLLASARELPENVKGVIADCPYSSAEDIIMRVGRSKKYPMPLLYPFLKLGARLYGKFSISDASPVSVIGKARTPILLIHGSSDGFVPHEMSVLLKEKNPDISFHSFPNADHGTSYCTDPERYRRITSEFLEGVLGNDEAKP